MRKILSNPRQWGLSSSIFLLTFVVLSVLSEQKLDAQIDIQPIVTHVTCNGLNNGSVELVITGGVGPYDISWIPSGNTGTVETGLAAGMAVYTVTDLGDPTAGPVFQQIPVTEPDVLVAYFLDNSDPNCFGECDGSASLEIVGGTPPYNFNWPAGAIVSPDGLSADGLCSGIVVIDVTDANLCSSAASQALGAPDPIVSSTTGSTDATCGQNNGTATVTASGGNGPYQYLWNDAPGNPLIQNGTQVTGDFASDLGAGTYYIDIIDATNCTAQAEVTIGGTVSNMSVVLNPTTNITCFGGNDGTATATVTGGTAPFTYVWSSGSGTNDGSAVSSATGLLPGPGFVTINDNDGCEETLDFTIVEPPVLVINIDATGDVTCPGAGNGSVTATATGGSGQFNFTYTDAAGTDVTAAANASTLPGGTYTATVTDQLNPGCISSVPFTIVEPTGITAQIDNFSDVSCFGLTDGSITASATGGTGTLSYAWAPSGGNSATASGLAAGTYTLTISDSAGCSTTVTQEIMEPLQMIAAMDPPVNIACAGDANGSATVTVTGGSGTFTYDWTDGVTTFNTTTGTALDLAAGNYTVTVIDATNALCTATATFIITEPLPLTASASPNDVSCFGLTDGSATLTITGGTAPYTENWAGAIPTALGAGTYDVIITDAANCSTTVPVVINEPTQIIATVAPTDISCFGANNGTAVETITGGSAPYTLDWGAGVDPMALAPGNYTLNILDANNCTASATFDIIEPAGMTVSVTPTDPLCFGATGTAVESITGGLEPYTLDWGAGVSPGALTVGTYTLTVTDANNCVTTEPFEVFEPTELTGDVSTTNVSCFGGTNGTALANITGGIEPYTYDWGGFSENALSAGDYTLLVSDANGCPLSLTFNITQPDDIVLTPATVDVGCFGGTNGTASLDIVGGTAPYTENWNGADQNALAAGTYPVTVTDFNNCTKDIEIIIGQPEEFSVTVQPTNVLCFGESTGTATPTIQGGTAPFTEDYGAGITPGALAAGLYTLTVTDANLCTATVDFEITEGEALVVDVQTSPVSCFGLTDGTATAVISGGIPPYTENYSADENALGAGSYNLQVVDANNCTFDFPFDITEPEAIVFSVDVSNVSCFGLCDGTATPIISGATEPVTYEWGGADPLALCAGNYSVVATDANGCPAFFDFTIEEPATVSLTVTPTPVGCFGEATGSVFAEATGGNGGFTYAYTDTDGNAVVETALVAGTYNVTATDATGCEFTEPFVIDEGAELTVTIDVIQNVSCAGAQDGQVTLTVGGNTAPIVSETWTDANGAPANPDALAGGTYDVLVTDESNCTATGTVTITEPELLEGDCASTENSMAITVTGGEGPYTYAWDGLPDNTPEISPIDPGTYMVTVTDANNCSIQISCDVIDPGCVTPLDIQVSTIGVDCFGDANGSAIAIVTGGEGNYVYEWTDNGSTTDEATGYAAGSYTVMVTDGDCVGSATFDITQPEEMFWSVECTPNGDEISVEAAGGTGTISYQWDDANNQQTATATGLSAGSYTVTATDENGCSIQLTCEITDPECEITLTINPTHLLCFGDDNGSAIAIVDGGTGPFEYVWTVNGSATSEATGLSAGPISVTVTDAEGCTQTASSEINEPELLEFVNACDVNDDGDITVTVTGGTGDYTYTWTPDVGTANTATGLDAGDYTVVVTDENNCSIEQTCTVPSTDCQDFIVTGEITNESCFGYNDGSILLNIDGGLPTFTYAWTPDTVTGSNPTDLEPGSYTVVVTSSDMDAYCPQTETFEILAATEFTAEATATQLACDGTGQSSITVVVTGGNGPDFTYNWTPNVSSTDSATDLDPGTYTIEVSDGSNCVATTTAIINESSIPLATVSAAPVLCDSDMLELDLMAFGQGDIEVTYTINGETHSSAGLSNGLAFTASYLLDNLDTTTGVLEIVLVSVEDENCLNSNLDESVSVSIVEALELVIITDVEPCADNNETYIVQFEINGGNSGAYSVDPASAGTISASAPFIFTSNPIASGTGYSFTIADDSGCAGVELVGDVDCNCETMAGTLDTAPIDICDDQQATVTILTDAVFDSEGDDAMIFILLENENDPIESGLQYSQTGVFVFSPPMTHNTTYYASMVVGNGDTDTGVDPNDPCLDTSPSVPITFYPFPVANAGINTATCGTQYALQAILDNGATGTWEILNDGGTNLNLSDLSDPFAMATVDAYGMVELNWTIAMGDCSDSQIVSIEFVEGVTTAVEPEATVCNTTDGGSIIDLSTLITEGVTTGTWTEIGTSGATFNGTTYDFDGIAAGTYSFNYLTPIDGECPAGSFPVDIVVEDCTATLACPTVLTLAEGAEELCEGGSVDLTVYESMITVDDPDGTYDGIAWFADENHAEPIDANYTPEYTGSCDPQLITVYPGVLCDLSGTIIAGGAITITVYPIATGELELSSSGCQLIAQLDCPNFAFDGEGIFQTLPEDYEQVTLDIYNNDAVEAGLEPCGNTIVNSFNCDELIKYISLPNAFSPNGDGLNDYFHPLEMTGVSEVRLSVHNRWGQKIFTTQDMYHQGWDGTFKGVDQEIGVYAYILHATFFDGKQKMLKGNVTLIK